jgi:hypothetical protein
VLTPLWQALGYGVIALAVAGRVARQAAHDARTEMAKTIDGFVCGIEYGRPFSRSIRSPSR